MLWNIVWPTERKQRGVREEGAGLQLCKDCKTNFLDTVTLQKVSGDEIKLHQMKTADISLTHLIINLFLFYAAAAPSGGAVPHLPLMQRRHCNSGGQIRHGSASVVLKLTKVFAPFTKQLGRQIKCSSSTLPFWVWRVSQQLKACSACQLTWSIN